MQRGGGGEGTGCIFCIHIQTFYWHGKPGVMWQIKLDSQAGPQSCKWENVMHKGSNVSPLSALMLTPFWLSLFCSFAH